MAICSATTACASKNASLTSGLRSVEKLSPTIGTTKQPFTRILPLSQRVAHSHCLSRAWGDGPMALLYGTAVPRRGRGTLMARRRPQSSRGSDARRNAANAAVRSVAFLINQAAGRSGGSGSSIQWVGASPLMPLYGISQPGCQPAVLDQKTSVQDTAITWSCCVGWPAPVGR